MACHLHSAGEPHQAPCLVCGTHFYSVVIDELLMT